MANQKSNNSIMQTLTDKVLPFAGDVGEGVAKEALKDARNVGKLFWSPELAHMLHIPVNDLPTPQEKQQMDRDWFEPENDTQRYAGMGLQAAEYALPGLAEEKLQLALPEAGQAIASKLLPRMALYGLGSAAVAKMQGNNPYVAGGLGALGPLMSVPAENSYNELVEGSPKVQKPGVAYKHNPYMPPLPNTEYLPETLPKDVAAQKLGTPTLEDINKAFAQVVKNRAQGATLKYLSPTVPELDQSKLRGKYKLPTPQVDMPPPFAEQK